MKTQGILFDFNGTMFFDEEFQDQAWRTFLEEKIGLKVTDEEMQTYVHGRNAEATFAYFFQRELSRKEVVTLEEEKEITYRSLCLAEPDKFCLAKGLPAFLDRLKQEGIAFTIATASGLNNVRFFFEQLGLGRWFELDKVVYNDGTFQGKPKPDIYLRAAENLDIPIEGCVVFEDSSPGIQSAHRAGAKGIIGVASMLAESELLSMDGVTGVIRDYYDAWTLIS